MFKQPRRVRPVLLGADHPESIKHAYASAKLLAGPLPAHDLRLLLVAPPQSPRVAAIAQQPGRLHGPLPRLHAAVHRVGGPRRGDAQAPADAALADLLGAQASRWTNSRPGAPGGFPAPGPAPSRAAPAALHTRIFPRGTAMYTAKGQLDNSALLKAVQPAGAPPRATDDRQAACQRELDDLIQVGMIGLSDALTRFDANQGVQFETFATQRIRGAMLDELRGQRLDEPWRPAPPAQHRGRRAQAGAAPRPRPAAKARSRKRDGPEPGRTTRNCWARCVAPSSSTWKT